MARQNVPLLSFNRGLISPKALARVDLDRTKLSAEVFTNWLPKTQGALTIRPGTKYLGSSKNDSGAQFIEFAAATDDTALLELTHQKMRVWVESDTGNTWETPASGTRGELDVPMARPKVDTTLTIDDTGWSNASSGGALVTSEASDQIPTMTAATTGGVTISAGNQTEASPAWKAADDSNASRWDGNSNDTGEWWWKVDFGAGNNKRIKTHTIRAPDNSGPLGSMPVAWKLQSSTNDLSWTDEVIVTGQSNWAVSEKRTFNDTGYSDTGGANTRYWRIQPTARQSGGTGTITMAEVELLPSTVTATQVNFGANGLTLNATSIGALARARKRVIVSDTGTEHSLDIEVTRGPVALRVGSSVGDDDYINETKLGSGYHNLAFTPGGDFHVTVQSDALVDRIVKSIDIGDSGTVEVSTFLDAAELDGIRYDQSADVVYCDCEDVEPHKIERRGTGRSWSFVEFQPNNGPFLSAASSSAKLSVSHKYGNTTLNSDVPFFRAGHGGHVGALMRLFHGGQSGLWPLGALNAVTDAVEVTGLSDTGDTGTPSQGSERRITVSVTGTYTGTVQLERSFVGPESGFHPVSTSGGYIKGGTAATDTGTFTRVINDPDDNSKVWYRGKMSAYTSGVALVSLTYPHGGVNGIARITAYNSNTDVDIETLSRFSDTGPTEIWQEGAWSTVQRFPSAVALHGGRLFHAGGGNLYGSVSDDYENFDDETDGDEAPISRTLGSGPVDSIYYLISLLRLIIGTSGAEISLRSSSLDEPVTPANSSAITFSTQGSANLRAMKMDTNAIFVQRSGQRLLQIGQDANALGEHETNELTLLVPDLLSAGVVSIAIQRQPDTRIHCVLTNGKVAILTYEPKEEVIAWSMWETDGTVEKAMVLPGTGEDKVYYHVNRTINGATKRYLERWAAETECLGDTGLSWLSDCSMSFSDTGAFSAMTGFTHLAAESVVIWADDTGQATAGKDLSPDVDGVQTTFTVSASGVITLSAAVRHHAVAGLPFTADWKSTKLAYAAEFGTALAQKKRTDKVAFALFNTHNNGLYFGNDTGNLDPLPRTTDQGGTVDADKIFSALDQPAVPFPGKWDADSRIHLRGKAPRPVTVLAAIPTIQTNERV